MNLYSRKQYTKIALLLLATVIVGVSLWYSSIIVNKIRDEERQKVQLWSQAIQKRAKLVNYTQKLFDALSKEERKKVDLWNSAVSYLINAPINSNLGFVDKIITDNNTIPIIVTDSDGKILNSSNLEEINPSEQYLKKELSLMKKLYKPLEIQVGTETQFLYYRDSKIFRELKSTMDDLIHSFISETVISSASAPVLYMDGSMSKVIAFGNIDTTDINDPIRLKKLVSRMKEQNDPLFIKLGETQVNYIFYEDSYLLTQLKYYPYVMLSAIGLFLIIAYVLFSTFRNAEQNQVWVGMAKETAHQLGTPLSSLIAWVDLLRIKGVAEETLDELNKDLNRLQVITDRFSKIGSKPELVIENLNQSVQAVLDYIQPRVSSKVSFTFKSKIDDQAADIPINKPLFEWVIENICKNAVDAMNGEGQITILLKSFNDQFCLDISDSGKGIPKGMHKTVFEPGFTTKKRGWGLGLSLCKRIIENYHQGSIFVKQSDANKGTTFRILLKRK